MTDDKKVEKKEKKGTPIQQPKDKPAAAPQKDKAATPQPAEHHFNGYRAEVVELIGKTGTRGEVRQVMCRVLDGRDRGRVIRRNVKGQIKKGDVLLLVDTEREAKQIKTK